MAARLSSRATRSMVSHSSNVSDGTPEHKPRPHISSLKAVGPPQILQNMLDKVCAGRGNARQDLAIAHVLASRAPSRRAGEQNGTHRTMRTGETKRSPRCARADRRTVSHRIASESGREIGGRALSASSSRFSGTEARGRRPLPFAVSRPGAHTWRVTRRGIRRDLRTFECCIHSA
jgi:hypothetical protein